MSVFLMVGFGSGQSNELLTATASNHVVRFALASGGGAECVSLKCCFPRCQCVIGTLTQGQGHLPWFGCEQMLCMHVKVGWWGAAVCQSGGLSKFPLATGSFQGPDRRRGMCAA